MYIYIYIYIEITSNVNKGMWLCVHDDGSQKKEAPQQSTLIAISRSV